jgi:hypothetical protein
MPPTNEKRPGKPGQLRQNRDGIFAELRNSKKLSASIAPIRPALDKKKTADSPLITH